MLRWLEKPGTRLVGDAGHLGVPCLRRRRRAALDRRGRGGAQRLSGGFGDKRDLRPVHQPGAVVSRIA